jgi:hypothetical protein
LGVTHYVIIDDNDWGIEGEHGSNRFVQTDWERGMGVQHAADLCQKLSNKNIEKCKEWDDAQAAELAKIMKEIEDHKNEPQDPDNDF